MRIHPRRSLPIKEKPHIFVCASHAGSFSICNDLTCMHVHVYPQLPPGCHRVGPVALRKPLGIVFEGHGDEILVADIKPGCSAAHR